MLFSMIRLRIHPQAKPETHRQLSPPLVDNPSKPCAAYRYLETSSAEVEVHAQTPTITTAGIACSREVSSADEKTSAVEVVQTHARNALHLTTQQTPVAESNKAEKWTNRKNHGQPQKTTDGPLYPTKKPGLCRFCGCPWFFVVRRFF